MNELGLVAHLVEDRFGILVAPKSMRGEYGAPSRCGRESRAGCIQSAKPSRSDVFTTTSSSISKSPRVCFRCGPACRRHLKERPRYDEVASGSCRHSEKVGGASSSMMTSASRVTRNRYVAFELVAETARACFRDDVFEEREVKPFCGARASGTGMNRGNGVGRLTRANRIASVLENNREVLAEI